MLSVSSNWFYVNISKIVNLLLGWFNELHISGDIVCEGVGGGDAACAKYCRDLGSGYTDGQCNSAKTCQCS